MTRPGRPATGRTSSTVTVRIPAAAYQKLTRQALRSGKGVSSYAKELVMWGINREPKEGGPLPRHEDQSDANS